MQKTLKEEIKFLQGKMDKNEDSILFARLADAYLQMDRVDEAMELCENGIKKHPYYVTGHYILGKCYLKKRLFDQAEKELKRVLLFDPKYIAAHRDYGELMAQIGWNNTCEMSYKEIIRIDPFNEKAKERLEEIREHSTLSREESPEEEAAMELEAVEEDILAEVSPPLEEISEHIPEEISEEVPEEIPEDVSAEAPQEEIQEFEPVSSTADSSTPPVVKELFKETEDIFEDDNVNLDLLEDIFRDEEMPDLSISEDFSTSVAEDSTSTSDQVSEAVDQKHLFGEEFSTEEYETKEFNGLEDDEIFALMAGDEEYNKPTMKSPLDIKEPDFRRERKLKEELPVDEIPEENQKEPEAQFEPSIERTLEDIQRETKPKFEPPMDKKYQRPQKEEESIQASEQSEILHPGDSQRKKEKIVTSTLGEIYAAQHQYAKAIGVYEILRRKDPDNELYKQKIEYLQKKLEESQSE